MNKLVNKLRPVSKQDQVKSSPLKEQANGEVVRMEDKGYRQEDRGHRKDVLVNGAVIENAQNGILKNTNNIDNNRKSTAQNEFMKRETEDTTHQDREGTDNMAQESREGTDIIIHQDQEETDNVAQESREGTDIIIHQDQEETDNMAYLGGEGTDIIVHQDREGTDNMVHETREGTDIIIHQDREGTDNMAHESREGTDIIIHQDREGTDNIAHESREGSDIIIHKDREGTDNIAHENREGTDIIIHQDQEGTDNIAHESREGADIIIHQDQKGTDNIAYQDGEVTDTMAYPGGAWKEDTRLQNGVHIDTNNKACIIGLEEMEIVPFPGGEEFPGRQETGDNCAIKSDRDKVVDFKEKITKKEEEEASLPWKALSPGRKLWRVSWVVLRLLAVLVLLYFFICSLDVLQDAFTLLGGRAAGSVFTNNAILNNPVCGLMIGVLVTVLVQSSSTSTSIVVSMVGSGLLEVRQAIPIVMGANIGTTVTNTIVSLTQSADRERFRLAFAGATVHDMFNWLTVLVLLPVEAASNYLFYLSAALTSNIGSQNKKDDSPEFLKYITTPVTKQIIQMDKGVITAIAEGKDKSKFPLPKYYCKAVTENFAIDYGSGEVNQTDIDQIKSLTFATDVKAQNISGSNVLTWKEVNDANSTKCTHLFVGSGLPGAALSEAESGAILLVFSLAALVLCLILMVKVLSSLLQGPMAAIIRKSINADFPGRAAFLTPYVALIIGACVTVLVQSSSVFTSALTPLVGLKVVTIERVYPLTLGSNIGTTVTSILAALTADANKIKDTLQIALCHLFFNITGIILFFPIPFLRRIPIGLAKRLGKVTSQYRWFAIVYLIVLFFLLPLIVFALSIAGWYVLVAVGGPFFLLFIFIVVVNVLQEKRPNWLVVRLRNWDFLPRPCHSLAPYDRIMTACCRHRKCPCRKCLDLEDEEAVEVDRSDSTTPYRVNTETEKIAGTRSPPGVVNTSFEDDRNGDVPPAYMFSTAL